MGLRKNEIYRSTITDYTTEGSGVCRIDGMAVFVPDSAVGDTADIRILKAAKNYAYGKIEKIITPSKDRCEPDCDVFRKCGGCTFRHISYEAELAFKQKRVTDTLTRIGGIPAELVMPIVGAEKINGYRNKAQLPLTVDKEGRICAGFFAARSHRVIPLEECALQSPLFDQVLKVFLEWANEEKIPVYDEVRHTGILRHLYMRHGGKTDELMVCVVINADSVRGEKRLVEKLCSSFGSLKTVVININKEKTNVITGKQNRVIYGSGYITDRLCGLEFRISPLSFYQVNRDQAERLYGIAAEFAGTNKGETLLDLYCGTGTIGLSMADRAGKLIGVEIIPQAIEDAKLNAQRNGISNAEFICADAARAAHRLSREGIRPDCIIVDPPRKGCDRELISVIEEMNPKRVVYVSCDPATLARDVKIFGEKGYTVHKAVPVDMFPRTGHVESVVLLTKVHN